jgi:CHASE2 domain-containing sensor protein
MNRIAIGIVFGMIAGIIDVIPMVLQKLTWDANLSAFSMWVIAGFLISTNGLRIHSMIKGILISFLLLIPCAFLIGWHQPISLLPISIMTLILGSLLGFVIQKFGKNK